MGNSNVFYWIQKSNVTQGTESKIRRQTGAIISQTCMKFLSLGRGSVVGT